MAFNICLENKLDIDNDTDSISSHTGGGGWRQAMASTSTTEDLRIASLFQLLWIVRYISLEQNGTSIAYTSPPPPRYHLWRRGVLPKEVKTRSRAHGVKNRNPKNYVKYTQDSMLFVVGLQVNEHVFFSPWKSQGGFFSSNSVKRPVNVDHIIFFHSFWRHFFNLRRSKYSPFKS